MSQKAGSAIINIESKHPPPIIGDKPIIVIMFYGHHCDENDISYYKRFFNDTNTNFIASAFFYENIEFLDICYHSRLLLSNILLGIKKIKLDKYLKSLFDSIISIIKKGKIIYLFGFSYGGAIVNLLYEQIMIYYNYDTDREPDTRPKKIIMTTFGSIYLSPIVSATDEIILTNYMDINDYFVSSKKTSIGLINNGILVPKYNEDDDEWVDLEKYNLTIILCKIYLDKEQKYNNVVWIRLYDFGPSLAKNYSNKKFFISNTGYYKYNLHEFGYLDMMQKIITNQFMYESELISQSQKVQSQLLLL